MWYTGDMQENFSFTVVLERGEQYWIAYCPEVPEANGQGRTREEAIDDLKEAVILALEVRREESMKMMPPDAVCEKLSFA